MPAAHSAESIDRRRVAARAHRALSRATHPVRSAQAILTSDEWTQRSAGPEELKVTPLDLVVVSGPDQGRTRHVDRAKVRIGTSEGCELLLTDRTVSRLHCEVVPAAVGARIVDLGSTNGT